MSSLDDDGEVQPGNYLPESWEDLLSSQGESEDPLDMLLASGSFLDSPGQTKIRSASIREGSFLMNDEIYPLSQTCQTPQDVIANLARMVHRNPESSLVHSLCEIEHNRRERYESGAFFIRRVKGDNENGSLKDAPPSARGASWRANTKPNQKKFICTEDWEVRKRGYLIPGTPHRCFLLVLRSCNDKMFHLYYFYTSSLKRKRSKPHPALPRGSTHRSTSA